MSCAILGFHATFAALSATLVPTPVFKPSPLAQVVGSLVSAVGAKPDLAPPRTGTGIDLPLWITVSSSLCSPTQAQQRAPALNLQGQLREASAQPAEALLPATYAAEVL
jgi:hypothetical protein